LILPHAVFAQFDTSVSGVEQELNMNIVPASPKPNDTVNITLTLYTGDLGSADIIWYKNDKEVLRGKGETRYSFKMGNSGETTKIDIAIRLMNGTIFSKSVTLTPTRVDLIWEANTYTPPFYKGKALHSRQGSIKIIALPEFIKDGIRISPQNLVYQWSNGQNVLESQSGYGKNVVTVSGSLLGRAESIDVLVSDPNSNLTANGSVNITPGDPKIIFYENSPYLGPIYDMAIGKSYELGGDEVEVLAAPYFFSNENQGFLNYSWRLNNQSIPELANSRTAIFKKPTETSGQSNLSLEIQNSNRVLQEASNNFSIKFQN